MKISIIIPAYNCQAYISDCLKSIINQTYKNIEIIIINDGSIDETGKICDYYSKLDNRIIVVHTENQGVSASRNLGLSMCKGDYIMFVDSDDWIEENACELIVNEIDQKSLLYFYSSRKYEDGRFLTQKEVVAECKINDLMADIVACPKYQFHYMRAVWGKVFKKEVLKDLQFSKTLYIGEDALFLLQCLVKINDINKVKFCKGYWYNYRILSSSAVRRYKNDLYSQDYIQFYEIKNLLFNTEYINTKSIQTSLFMLYWEIVINLIINEMAVEENKNDSKQWIHRENIEINFKLLDYKRFSKTQFVILILLKIFGLNFTERILRTKVKYS